MAYPNLYGVTYSYAGFQQSQQGISAFPGTQLDADLAGLTSSIDGLSAFLERTIRSDGNLNNGIVNYDSLSPALQSAGLAPASPWATATAYAQSSNVVFGVGFYRCLVPHTSGVFATDLAAGDWLLIATMPTSDTTATTGIIYAFNSGAVPGSADASPGIMAAVNLADSFGGPTVKLTSGIFKLNSTIALNKWESRSSPPLTGLLTVPGLKIDGAGKGVTFLDTNVANGYAIAANPAWRAVHLSQYLTTVSALGGLLATNTYFVQITKTDPLGNEINVTLAKQYAVTGPTGSISIPLQATSPGYVYNIYADVFVNVNTPPAHRATVAGVDAIGVAGGQTVTITAIGSAHVIPTDKQAVWQEVSVSNLTIISSSGAANASGVLYFKVGYVNLTNVEVYGLKGSGFDVPDYTGDIDGSFFVKVRGCKFDGLGVWGINAAGVALELSNLSVEETEFNLCGTAPANLNTVVGIVSITNGVTPTVTATSAHNLAANDQVYVQAVAGMALPAGYYRASVILSSLVYTLTNLDGSALDTTALGAYTANSGSFYLAWRPPYFNLATGAVVGSGAMAWLGLIGTFRNLGLTQNNNVGLYVAEHGSSDNLVMEAIDFENTAGKAVYIGGLTGGSWTGGEILSAVGAGNTISGCQIGTGFAAGGVKNFDIAKSGGIKVRNNVSPTVGFEQFMNTNIGKTYADTVRVGRIDWAAFDASGQTRFTGFVFDPIPGQVQLSVTAQNTFKLAPIGYGGALPLHLKAPGEWVAYHVPSAGITTAVATLAPNTSYNIFAYNSADASSPITVQITATAAGTVLNEGYKVSALDATQTFVGVWPTDGAGNFQPGGSGVSFYPPSVATNLTGTAAGLTAGHVTTNANMTGDVTSVGNATTLTNAPVIAKVLTGYVAGAGTVAATDSILQAVQKLGGLVDNAAWAAYTPTITPGGGAFTGATITPALRWKQSGKTVRVQGSITVTALGSGSPTGALIATLPVTAVAGNWQCGTARDNTTGNVGSSFILNSDGTKVFVVGPTGGSAIVAGSVLVISIEYEAA